MDDFTKYENEEGNEKAFYLFFAKLFSVLPVQDANILINSYISEDWTELYHSYKCENPATLVFADMMITINHLHNKLDNMQDRLECQNEYISQLKGTCEDALKYMRTWTDDIEQFKNKNNY